MQLSPESDNVRWPSSDSGEHVWPDSGMTPPDPVRSGRIPPEVGPPASGVGGWMSSDSGADSIPMAG
jgi:hypothetical protein